MYREYCYKGPVMKFDICIKDKWTAVTRAKTSEKAVSNLKYRFKKEYGLSAGAKISLPGKLTTVGGN